MMEKKDQLEEMLKEEFDRIAREEEAFREDEVSMPEGAQENIYAVIQEKIREKEQEKENEYLYSQLSEEDMKALELGRKIMEEEAKGERRVKVARKKRRARLYVALAAALVLTMATGVTSMGGPERIIQMVKRAVGDREVTQIDSDDNLKTKGSEEEAYQKIKEVLGVDPVKVMAYSENIKFESMEIDEEFQIVEIFYKYNNERIVYLINASYERESLGIDMEDEIVNKYSKEIQEREIVITEYKMSEGNAPRFQAHFEDRGLEYFLIGTMEKEDFENIVDNLYFMR